MSYFDSVAVYLYAWMEASTCSLFSFR